MFHALMRMLCVYFQRALNIHSNHHFNHVDTLSRINNWKYNNTNKTFCISTHPSGSHSWHGAAEGDSAVSFSGCRGVIGRNVVEQDA